MPEYTFNLLISTKAIVYFVNKTKKALFSMHIFLALYNKSSQVCGDITITLFPHQSWLLSSALLSAWVAYNANNMNPDQTAPLGAV